MGRYDVNAFMYDTGNADKLAAYKADPAAFLAQYHFSDDERRAIETLDVPALYRAGVNPYRLRYFCLSMGVGTPQFLGAFEAVKAAAQDR